MTMRILVADDFDHSARDLVKLLTADTGCEGVFAKDGQEAIDSARERRPDAAILDVDMPRVDGIEAAEAILAMYPVAKPLMIAITGRWTTDEIRETGLFDHIMKKPLKLDELLRIIRGRAAS